MAQAAVRAASSSSAAMPLVVRATAQGSLRLQRSAHAAPRNKLVAASVPSSQLDAKRTLENESLDTQTATLELVGVLPSPGIAGYWVDSPLSVLLATSLRSHPATPSSAQGLLAPRVREHEGQEVVSEHRIVKRGHGTRHGAVIDQFRG